MNKKWICLCLISVLLLYSCDSNKSVIQSTGTTSTLRIESIETKETSEITSSSTTVAQTKITTETIKVIETTTESTVVETTIEQTTESTTKTTKAQTKSTTEKPTTTEVPTTTTDEPSEEPTTTTEEPTTTTTEATTTTTETKQGSLGNTSGSFNKGMANEVLTLVNQEREANGVAPLSWSNSLTKTADIRATELVVSFSHTRPDGSEWWTAGDQLQMAENLAFGQQSASEVVADWLGSTGHRANILNESYTSLGVSCYCCNGVYYWAQEFA